LRVGRIVQLTAAPTVAVAARVQAEVVAPLGLGLFAEARGDGAGGAGGGGRSGRADGDVCPSRCGKGELLREELRRVLAGFAVARG
jgi:hypothetical protein